MPAPLAAAAAPAIKGLLGAGVRGAATGGFRAAAGNAAKGMAADAVQGGAKEGMKNFARNMTGKTSDDYKARVDGVNPETGEYLTPEERKARFKGFATSPVKESSQKLLPGAAQPQEVPALAPAGGVGNDDQQEKVVNHLEKIQMYLEKLLIIEQNALSRLQDKILSTARADDRDSAEEEEENQEKGKPKKKSGKNPLVRGIKKKASGIFSFLMDFAMKFVGMKILDWISKPENQEKIQKIVGFFQSVLSFITTTGKIIGDAFNFSVDVIRTGIEGITFLAEKVQEFFTFEWLNIDTLLEPLKPIVSFFTETIPSAMNGFLDGLAGVITKLDNIPNQFVGVVQKITNGFLEFIGLPPEDTEPIKEPKDGDTAPIPENGQSLVPTDAPSSSESTGESSPGESKPPKMKRGGYLSGRTHAQGGQVIEAEGGEYVMNRRAVAAIGRDKLDAMNFGQYPTVGGGGGERENPRSMASTGGIITRGKARSGGIITRGKARSGGTIINIGDKAESGGLIQKFAKGGSVHPLLTKMNDKNIKKANAPVGRCVTGSLDTMKKSGVPEPAATGRDEGNNPRGGMVQMIKDFGWKSMGGTKTPLSSPYGDVTPGIFTKDQYLKKVDEGKVPSGALVFQTRHPSWTGTSYNSRGFDMAIAQKNGKALWNGVLINDPLVYAGTKKVVVLTPDGKENNGSTGEFMDSGPDNASGSTVTTVNADGTTTTTTTTTATPKKKTPEVDLSLLKAILAGPELSGQPPSKSSSSLKILQSENNILTTPGIQYDESNEKIFMSEKSPSFTTGFDENVLGGLELGENIPPFTQAVFPFNL